MYLGTQNQTRTDVELQVHAQLGVKHICSDPPGPWQEWDVDHLKRYREKVESYGITLDMFQLPVDCADSFLAQPPPGPGEPLLNLFGPPDSDRDREIDQVCQLIRNASEAGIPSVKYFVGLLKNLRTEPRHGRGGAELSSFEWSKLDTSLPPFPGTPISADEIWERIDYFLARLVPVATECGVRIACHPWDPGIADRTWRGAPRTMGTIEGLKKYVMMHESPYHGLNFCQGTVCEMLEDPAREIFDVIRWFGERKKIFNVHFRNIRGGLYDFVEVFPDEGDVDMLAAARVYREVDYPYMLMPDHVPGLSGEAPDRVGFAFCYGYITAVLQAVDAE